MDPVTAIGLASGILSFITFSTDVLHSAVKIHGSVTGAVEENRSLEVITREMDLLSSRLLARETPSLLEENASLCSLATECQKLSREILALFDKIKPSNPKSKRQSLRSAAKDKYYEKDKQELEKRLAKYRSQLELELASRNSLSTKTLISISEYNTSELKALGCKIDQLLREVERPSISPKADAQLRDLITSVQKGVSTHITQARFLTGLEFAELHNRYQDVHESYSNTFQWLSDNKNGPLPLNEAQNVAGEKWINWLSSDAGIFHISGKMGSGKSTLMKFLYEDRRTNIELQKWAGGRPLVLAKFFFWRHGTHLQNSLDGLYRSLLFGVLASCPGLIAHVFSEKWATAVAEPWQIQTPIKPSPTEIRMAFEKLIEFASKSDDRCFCFFIDGLDEFQDTTRVNNREMTEKLHSWVKDAPKSLKLCISSREENVFMTAFSAAPRIRLHDLTLRDMEKFVREKLACIPDRLDREGLVDSIVDKAQGIFQWVALVTKSVSDELENGATINQLKKELEFLPEELDELYDHILGSLKPETRRKAWQTFEILRLADNYRITLSLLAYSFLEEYEEAPGFAMANDFPLTASRGRTPQERSDYAAKKLNGNCRGLVEPTAKSNLGYAHRSVADFLQVRRTKDTMASNLRTFNGVDALSQLVLAEVRLEKVLAPTKYDKETPGGSLGSRINNDLLFMRGKEQADQPPYEFLSFLETYAEPIPWADLDDENRTVELSLIATGMVCATKSRASLSTNLENSQVSNLHSPLYLMTNLGYHDYPVWKILHDPAVTDSPVKVLLLAYCQLQSMAAPHPHDSVLQLLLSRGFLSINTPTRMWPMRVDRATDGTGMSIWQSFLLLIYIRPYHWGKHYTHHIAGRYIEVFLQHQPDLNISITFKETKNAIRVEIGCGPDKESLQFTMHKGKLPSFSVPSLRTWIEDSDLENKEQLLKLYDSQLEEAKAGAREQGAEHAISKRVNTRTHKRQITLEKAKMTEPSGLPIGDGSITKSEVRDETALEPPLGLSEQKPAYIDWGRYLLVMALGALLAILIPILWNKAAIIVS